MSIDLYYLPGSPPCRAVRLVAAAVGVELNLKMTDLSAGEHLTPEFIQMNPQHTIPTLDDNGFYLSESRVICTYLADKYAEDDSLYPKDPEQRAIVNHRLFFDMDKLYRSFTDYFFPQMFAGAPADPDKLEKCHEALDYLDKFLENQNYVAGDHMTIADLMIVTTVSNFTIIDFDLARHMNTVIWLEQIKSEAPDYEGTNGEGLQALNEKIKSLMEK